MNERLNTVPTEVIWKWQQYGNNSLPYFAFPAPVEDVFLNWSANNPVVDSWNQSDI